VRVHDSTADMRYMVLPMRPAGTGGFDEEALVSLVGRDAMVGVVEAGTSGQRSLAAV
jgi:nitrile hydratase